MSQPPMKRVLPLRPFALMLTLLLIGSPQVADAMDESATLSLLAETIDATASNPAVCCALMRGMLSGLEGRRNVSPPPGWAKLSEKLDRSDDSKVRDLSFQLSQVFGDSKATRRSLALVKDTKHHVNIK